MRKIYFSLFTLLVPFLSMTAHNPIIQTHFTADPAPLVLGDTLFLYVGCDEKDAPLDSYLMREYRLYTTTDMVNWTDCGAILRTSAFKWSAGDASAAQCIGRDGKYYFYISSQNNTIPGSSIGVAVADSPYGPFRDALGHALVTNDMTTHARHSWDDLDPTVYIDDDGKAWLYWGNGVCYRAGLNDDMISLAGEIEAIDARDASSFVEGFTEAPWVYGRDGKYYMIYASRFPESIHYSMSDKIDGKWTAKGVVMPLQGGSNTNHPGIVDFKGHSYFFYHNDALPGGHSYCRSVCVEEFVYGDNGEIPSMQMTSDGIVDALGVLNPYIRVEAETMAWSEGVTAMENEERGVYVAEIHDGDYIKVMNVDFGSEGPASFSVISSSRYQGGSIELHIDSIDGDMIGSVNIPYTGEWDIWKEFSSNVSKTTGVHDLFLVFKGKKPHQLFNLDCWKFEPIFP